MGLSIRFRDSRDMSRGWTVQGHAGYWGYAWYRLVVHVQARPGEKLALTGPSDVDDVYQVFANGQLLGQFGDFSTKTPIVIYTQPMMFSLHKQGDDGAGNTSFSTQVLAFRVFMLPSTLEEAADVGGFHTAPLLGDAATVAADYRMKLVGIDSRIRCIGRADTVVWLDGAAGLHPYPV